MSEPITVTELDAATKAELQPPCRMPWCDPRGPAAWIAYDLACSNGTSRGAILVCTPHARSLMDGNPFNCKEPCCGGRPVVPSFSKLERLR